MEHKERILKYLEENAKYTPKNIADALGISEQEVTDVIRECEADGTILGYKTMINWDKTEREYVSALIEIKVLPVKGEGFDSVAEYICSFPEVVSVSLMSGGFDLAVTLEGKTMKDVARFVFDKLAVIDGVTSTATHFVLNKYKDKNVVIDRAGEDDDRVLVL